MRKQTWLRSVSRRNQSNGEKIEGFLRFALLVSCDDPSIVNRKREWPGRFFVFSSKISFGFGR